MEIRTRFRFLSASRESSATIESSLGYPDDRTARGCRPNIIISTTLLILIVMVIIVAAD